MLWYIHFPPNDNTVIVWEASIPTIRIMPNNPDREAFQVVAYLRLWDFDLEAACATQRNYQLGIAKIAINNAILYILYDFC
jgi:hypothetical protein